MKCPSFLLSLTLSAFVAGCGGDGDDGGPSGAGTTTDAGPGSGGIDASAAADAAAGGDEVDLTGTWISQVNAMGTITVPLVASREATIDLVLRDAVTRNGDDLDHHLEICRLDTVTTDNALTVNFPGPVLALLTDDARVPDPHVTVGGSVRLPDAAIVVGQDDAGNPVDDDGDGLDGVTIPATLLGSPIRAGSGLTIALRFPTVTLVDAETEMGESAFTTSGTVFVTDPLDLSGPISVTPSSPTTPFTAMKLPGDVPCSDVTAALSATRPRGLD